MKNIIQMLVDEGIFTNFIDALRKADLVDSLEGNGPFTLFSPVDEAFKALPKTTVEYILTQDIGLLKHMLRYHVINGIYTLDTLRQTDAIESIQGQALVVDEFEGERIINDAKILAGDIECTNGIIHAIDMVLMPEVG